MIHSHVHMSVFLCSENRMFCIPSLADNTWTDKSSSSSLHHILEDNRGPVTRRQLLQRRADKWRRCDQRPYARFLKDQQSVLLWAQARKTYTNLLVTTSWDPVGECLVSHIHMSLSTAAPGGRTSPDSLTWLLTQLASLTVCSHVCLVSLRSSNTDKQQVALYRHAELHRRMSWIL